MEIALLVLVIVTGVGGYFMGRKATSTQTTVVEEFKIETVGKEGFRKLVTRFEDAQGRIYRFEWHPAYAHHFSDELVKSSARALAPGETE